MKSYAKAIVSALVALLSVLATSAADGLTQGEWFAALGAGLAAGLAVYQVPNAPVEGGEEGMSVIELCLIVVALVLFFAFFQVSPRH